MARSRYSADEIQVLEGLEGVRRRPHLFVRDLENGGAMHRLLFEIVGIAIAEHRRGFGRRIGISIDGDTVTIEDDGNGVPIETIETVMTQITHRSELHRYMPLPPSLLDHSIPVTNALSSELEVTVWRDGCEHFQRYERGERVAPVQMRGPKSRSGMRIMFTLDFTIFTPQAWDVTLIEQRCRALAALFSGLEIELNDATYRYESLDECVRDLTVCDVIEPLHIRATQNGIDVELVLAWGKRGALHCFANNGSCERGVHVDALRAAVRNVIACRRPSAHTERLDEHLVALLHVRLDEPRVHDWGHALKNPEVGDVVRDIVERELVRHLEATPALLDRILIDLE